MKANKEQKKKEKDKTEEKKKIKEETYNQSFQGNPLNQTNQHKHPYQSDQVYQVNTVTNPNSGHQHIFSLSNEIIPNNQNSPVQHLQLEPNQNYFNKTETDINDKLEMLISKNKYLQQQLDVEKKTNVVLNRNIQIFENKCEEAARNRLTMQKLEEDIKLLTSKYEKSKALRNAQEISLKNLQVEIGRIKPPYLMQQVSNLKSSSTN